MWQRLTADRSTPQVGGRGTGHIGELARRCNWHTQRAADHAAKPGAVLFFHQPAVGQCLAFCVWRNQPALDRDLTRTAYKAKAWLFGLLWQRPQPETTANLGSGLSISRRLVARQTQARRFAFRRLGQPKALATTHRPTIGEELPRPVLAIAAAWRVGGILHLVEHGRAQRMHLLWRHLILTVAQRYRHFGLLAELAGFIVLKHLQVEAKPRGVRFPVAMLLEHLTADAEAAELLLANGSS
ncbi:hypothetical protein [Phytopseudomonas flavescens]|uniref:hypothetical protein n=1 Tax=Phytopseudomonas flavescens TaxID=29435 RepID=UPI0011133845|nr:hypothetical protein [Pseudomonas flavescens]